MEFGFLWDCLEEEVWVVVWSCMIHCYCIFIGMKSRSFCYGLVIGTDHVLFNFLGSSCVWKYFGEVCGECSEHYLTLGDSV